MGGALAGSLGTEVPQRGPRAEPRWGLGVKPTEAQRTLPDEAEKTTYGVKKQVHTD